MAGEIKYYKAHGKKIYFKRSDINEWVFRERDIDVSEDVDGRAEEIFRMLKEKG